MMKMQTSTTLRVRSRAKPAGKYHDNSHILTEILILKNVNYIMQKWKLKEKPEGLNYLLCNLN